MIILVIQLTYGLIMDARYGAKALSILTISDHILKGLETTPEERETTFTDMMEIALEIA